MKLGYEYCYLYTALCPFEGHLISLILPDMTKESFSMFIDYFKEQTQHLYGRQANVLLITDGAGAHQADVTSGSNITLEKLPAAAPELNPVERFFEELRKELSNRVFEDIDAVEDKLCQVLQPYYRHKQAIIQLCHFPYLSTA
jgi:transposase